MKIGIIVQARMGSRRLPGKILAQIDGKPMLWYQLERLKICKQADEIIVATSIEKEDDPVAILCDRLKTECFRGSLIDVASRFLGAIDRCGLDAFVRISGDSPLIDPAVVDRAARIFREGDYDIVTNVLKRTFPKGQSVEVIRAGVFKTGCGLMRTADELEHVTKFFYREQSRFNIFNFVYTSDCSSLNLSVDTKEDLGKIAGIIQDMNSKHRSYNIEEVIRIYQMTAAGESHYAQT